jgi:hypothetical protein
MQALLDTFFDPALQEIDAAAGRSSATIYQVFKPIYDDDLWNLLLLRDYTRYKNILNLLPKWPAPEFQRAWVGNDGFDLSRQTLSFYTKIKEYFRIFGRKPLSNTRLLDFGCGWGRILRYFAKDIPDSQLFGCDSDPEILRLCRELAVPGIFGCSDIRPKRLPFFEKFDLVYAFSVFTHLSESTHLECLQVIHDSMHPGGLLIVTIRPRSFIDIRGNELRNASQKEIKRLCHAYDVGEYAFLPHNWAPVDGEVPYGDACTPLSYIQKNWTRLFKLTGIGAYCADMYQIPVLLQPR